MLVSTNVLTPFSYAQVETPEVIPENEVENVEEIGETPEKDNEITGEISNSLWEVEWEWSLPLVKEVVNESEPEGLKEEVEDSLDAVESPTIDEDKKEDPEKGGTDEVAKQGEENAELEKQEKDLEWDEVEEATSLQKVEDVTVMQVGSWTSATLLPWKEFNAKLKKLSGQWSATYYYSDNTTIKQMVYTWAIPSWVTTTWISTSDSEKEIIAWYDSGTIYYYTEANTIYLNPDSSYMFSYMQWLTGLDLTNLDSSMVTNMYDMFYYCNNLTELNVSNWDTSNVTNMSYMFYYCSNLKELDLSNWDLGKITDASSMQQMLWSTNSLKTLSMSGWKIPQTFTDVMWRYWGYPNNSIEEVDVTNWDLNETKNVHWLFADSKSLKTIKWLETWDLSNVENMSQMFQNCSNLTWLDLSNWNTSNVTDVSLMFYGCYNLESLEMDNWNTSNVINMWVMFYWCSGLNDLDLSSWDTKNVTRMEAMFYWCSGLNDLDLSSWDTKNVTRMESMFYWCSNLESLNLNWWDLWKNPNMSSFISSTLSLKSISMSGWKIPENFTNWLSRIWWWYTSPIEEIDVNNRDLSETKSLNGVFWSSLSLKTIKWLDTRDTSSVANMGQMFLGCSSLTWLDLSNFNTSNVTDMSYMFYWCSWINELNLSNFNTSNVTNMASMFYNTPNLKTIYASNKFVTTALSWDTSSKDMFSWTISVIWWNGTKFDPNYIDKTYAKIDKVWQTWYFTDKNAINVKFINTLDWTETVATFKKWQKLTPPSVNGYHVVWWYLDEEMTQSIDLDKWVDRDSVIYVKYDRNGSSGWWGRWWSSKKTNEGTHWSAEDSQKNTQDDKNTENVIQSDPEHSEWGSEESSNTPVDSSADKSASESQEILSPSDSSFTKEQKDAYIFAKENWITTKDTIQSAQMNGKLTRIAMAKMLSQYAINVLWQTPDTSKTIKFRDVTSKKDADYDNWVTLAYQLWIMWQNMPWNNFRPNDEVTRAEFATALSRMAYNTSDWEYKSTSKYYIHHMEKLVNEWIITNDNPNMKELRWYVMIMLMRSAK